MSAIFILILRVITVLSLYLFLGLNIYILWRDLFNEKSQNQLKPQIKISNLTSGESMFFSLNEMFIGRSDLAHIQLFNDDSVSNMHARIYLKANNWWVEDLQSTNGTLINQEPMITPTLITSGDQISCGKSTIEITIDNPTTSE